MAVTGVAAAQDHAISTSLEGPQNEHGVEAAGTGNADDLDIIGIAEPVGTGKVGTGIRTPVAAEGNDGGLEFTVYLHIASTSAMICLLLKPFRSIAPEGQATVQAPQPWQTAGLTEATRRMSVVRLGPRNSLSE